MSDVPSGLHYSDDHEYIRKDGDLYVIGVTDYAQGELGDVVFVELPSAGESLSKGDSFGTIEAVKAVSDLFAPVSGEVVEVNQGLDDDPSLVNAEPYGAGWMIKVRLSDEGELKGLMDADAYKAHIGA